MRLTRKSGGVFGGIFIIILLLSIFFAKDSYELETEKNNQFYPAIYENIIVWEDDRNGNVDIYGYNLLTGQEFQITTDPHDQLLPVIHRDIVVWQDNRNGNWDIYGYDLSRKHEFHITTSEADQISPAMCGNVVVWQDNRLGNWDIYGYDLSTNREIWIMLNSADQCSPAIYKDIVVWEDFRNGNWDIYGYNFLTSQIFPVTTNMDNQRFPAIHGDTVVWMDSRNGNWDIYYYNLSNEAELPAPTGANGEPEKGEIPVTTNPNNQRSPAIYKNIVVWYDCRGGSRDIYGYNLSEGEFSITTDGGIQQSPAIYRSIVVWMEETPCDWNIYGYNLLTGKEFLITAPIPPPPCQDDRSPYLFAYGIITVAVAAIILSLHGITMVYPGKETKKLKICRVNVLKDSQSNTLIERQFFFVVLFLFFSLNIVTNYFSGTLIEIDINSLPREKAAFMYEGTLPRPALKDPLFILLFLIPLIIYYPVRNFFRSIPDIFGALCDNGAIMKKGSTCEEVLADFNKSLENLEDKINGYKIYLPGICIYAALLLIYFPPANFKEFSYFSVSWNHSGFFPENWIASNVVAVSLMLMSAILVTKMFLIVLFMKELNQYDMALRPYDTDGLGGFKPLETLWFNMISVVMPVLAVFGVLSLLDRYVGIAHYSVERFLNLFLFSIGIVVLLLVLILYYYRMVKTQKTKMLNDIDKKIQTYYEKAHITEEGKDVDEESMRQIEQLQKVVFKVKSIPSFPFTTLHKIYILSSTIIPLVIQIINYVIQP